MQKTFDAQAVANQVYPLGAGIWLRLHPEDRIKTPYSSWQFDATTTRMPEFTAPGLGRESSTVPESHAVNACSPIADTARREKRVSFAPFSRLGSDPPLAPGQGEGV